MFEGKMSYPGRSHGLRRQTPDRPAAPSRSESCSRVCVQAKTGGRTVGTTHTHTASKAPEWDKDLVTKQNSQQKKISQLVELTELDQSGQFFLRLTIRFLEHSPIQMIKREHQFCLFMSFAQNGPHKHLYAAYTICKISRKKLRLTLLK